MERPHRAAPAARLIIVSALLFGCIAVAAGDWPTYLHDAQRTGSAADETLLSTSTAPNLTTLWSIPTGGGVEAAPTVANGTVYAGAGDGYEYALDAVTGALTWKAFLGTTWRSQSCPGQSGVESTATVTNGALYVGGADGNWDALDATGGALLWQVPTGINSPTGGNYNWSSPLLYDGYAYVGVASKCDIPLVQGTLLSTPAVVSLTLSQSTSDCGWCIFQLRHLFPAQVGQRVRLRVSLQKGEAPLWGANLAGGDPYPRGTGRWMGHVIEDFAFRVYVSIAAGTA